MYPVASPDGEAVSISGRDPDVEVRAPGFDAASDRQRAPMQAVESIGTHVVWQAAGAADAGHCNRFLRWYLGVPADPVHGGQDAMVAAASAPTRRRAAIIFHCEISIFDLQRPVTF